MSAIHVYAGALLARMRLCSITRVSGPGGETCFRKVRLPHSGALLGLARWMPGISPNVVGLSTREWIAWERQMWRLLHGRAPSVVSRGVMMSALPGVSLREWLRDRDAGFGAKLAALQTCLDALCNAHELRVRWPCGSEQTFSHSDAHAGNVFYDPRKRCAYWFDFETIHQQGAPEPWRRADDIRALTYSAAAELPPDSWPQLIAQVLARVGEDVRVALVAIVERLARAPHLLHLSQAPMSAWKLRQMSDRILQKLTAYR